MEKFFNDRLLYDSKEEKAYYYTDIRKQFKFNTNKTGFKLLKNLLNNINKMLDLNKKKIKEQNLDFNKIIEEGKNIYVQKQNKNVLKKVGTWSISEYKHLGMLHLYMKIKSFQRFTENWTMIEKADQLFPSLFKKISGTLNVASIGGGPGFELVAFEEYFNHNTKYRDKKIKINFFNIDLVDDWEDYYKLNGDNYFFKKGDFFKLDISKKMDYIFLSNTFATYLNNYNGWKSIVKLLNNCKAIFINDRKRNLNNFKEYIKNKKYYMIQILGKKDHRQIIITKNYYNIPNKFILTFPNVPFVD